VTSITLPTGIGIGFRFDHLTVKETQEIARHSEELGYRAIWLTDSFGRDPLIHAGQLLSATNTLTVGTAVLNIHLRTPESVGGAPIRLPTNPTVASCSESACRTPS